MPTITTCPDTADPLLVTAALAAPAFALSTPRVAASVRTPVSTQRQSLQFTVQRYPARTDHRGP
jgi:hypothetical protein